MSGFKEIKNREFLRLRQRGGVSVFLESEEDYQIIAERWFFDEGETLNFETADRFSPENGGGGCNAVLKLVEGASEESLCAFGLVDRDSLMRDECWDQWKENDDEKFHKDRPFGDQIRVLLRWEIENYLLDPTALEVELADIHGRAVRDTKKCAEECLGYIDELRAISATNVALNRENKTGLKPGFGSNPRMAGTELTEALELQLENASVSKHKVAFQKGVSEIKAFDLPDADPLVRWERVTRMLDGKCALKYLGSAVNANLEARRYGLARRLKENGMVPRDVSGFIDEFKAAAPA